MIRRSDRTLFDRFATQLLTAMGIGSLASLAVAAASCGGTVTQGAAGDQTGATSGAGGATGAGTSANTTSGVGTGGASTADVGTTAAGTTGVGTTGAGGSGQFACDVKIAMGQKLVYACLNDGTAQPCASNADPAVLAQLQKQLDTTGCPITVVTSVPCGPDPSVESCCYYAIEQQELCGGRPFVVLGVSRTANVSSRAGWAAELAPALEALDPATRRALADAWAREAAFEHASIASFARFTMELLAVGAPADFVSDAQRAMGDEIRHAELCFGLASAYAGAPIGPGRLGIEGALGGREDLRAIALATVREACIGETIAAIVALAARDAAEDPAVRAALDRIAEDEAAHAALAWRFIAWIVKEGPADLRDAVKEGFAAGAPGEDVAAYPNDADAKAMRAHGRLDAEDVRALASRAWTEVITPCANAMFASARAAVGVILDEAARTFDAAQAYSDRRD